ncbi:MAG: hypothetical protein H7Y17_14100 [Chlorobia bacterium]|nr:hypothetical protein [Fimbriimonadaceae bacterium]
MAWLTASEKVSVQKGMSSEEFLADFTTPMANLGPPTIQRMETADGAEVSELETGREYVAVWSWEVEEEVLEQVMAKVEERFS